MNYVDPSGKKAYTYKLENVGYMLIPDNKIYALITTPFGILPFGDILMEKLTEWASKNDLPEGVSEVEFIEEDDLASEFWTAISISATSINLGEKIFSSKCSIIPPVKKVRYRSEISPCAITHLFVNKVLFLNLNRVSLNISKR